MGQIYHEFLIKRKKTIVDVLLRIIMVLLCVLCVVLMPRFGTITFILGVLFIYLTRYVFQATSVEYEYTFRMGECQIDKICGQIRRKGCGKIEMDKVELIAKEGSSELNSLEKEAYKLRNFTSREKDARIYVAFERKDSELIKVVFEPNDDILNEMQLCAPRKVIIAKEQKNQ